MSDFLALLYAPLLVALAASSLRWLRVAQREHYLAGSVMRFAWRWWWLSRRNRLLLLFALAALVGSIFVDWLATVAVIVVLVGPIGLTHKGRTGKLRWTRRLVTVSFATAALVALVLLIAFLIDSGSTLNSLPDSELVLAAVLLSAAAIALPALVDLALLITKPIEALLLRRWVRRARKRLNQVNPIRVAITGSYGKTTVKGYLRHLLSGTYPVVASPASYNNTAGLCLTVNDHLRSDTEVMIAEMGTYGRGEIAAMVRWVEPSISILTAVGPVHLERFGRLDNVVAAKTEIFATSRTAILNVDIPRLEAEAARLESSGIFVVRCSGRGLDVAATANGYGGGDDSNGNGNNGGNGNGDNVANSSPKADVRVHPAKLSAGSAAEPADGSAGSSAGVCEHRITLFDREIAVPVPVNASLSNVACAVAAASELGVSDAEIAERFSTLPTAEHRRQQSVSPSGVVVIDDTYNSNPVGAKAALEMLRSADVNRRVVITPGMVELGSLQFKENASFAETATAKLADDFVIVGQTNRAALLHGAHSGTAVVHQVSSREAAVSWVRANLTAGDGVLYENDLPDHYP